MGLMLLMNAVFYGSDLVHLKWTKRTLNKVGGHNTTKHMDSVTKSLITILVIVNNFIKHNIEMELGLDS